MEKPQEIEDQNFSVEAPPEVNLDDMIEEWQTLKGREEEFNRKEKRMKVLEAMLQQKEKNIKHREEDLQDIKVELDTKSLEIQKEQDSIFTMRIELQEKYENEISVKYKKILEDLNHKLSDKNVLDFKVKELGIENEGLQEENKTLKERVLHLKKESEAYLRNIDAIAEVEDLKAQVKVYRDKYEETDKLKHELKRLKDENEEMQLQIKELTNDKDILSLKLRRLANKLEEYQERERAKTQQLDNTTEDFMRIVQEEKDLMTKQEERYQFNSKRFIIDFMNFVEKAGFKYEEKIVKAFVAAIKSSRFSILKGYSGTGKSSLPKLLAMFLGAHCEVIPVQPNWKTKNDLMGFYNHFNNRYISTTFTQTLLRANVNQDKIFFILLDEMNLSRVEYYFSEINSKLNGSEDEEYIELFDGKLPMAWELENYITEGNKIKIPPNVFFIGTINEDDSVTPISDKIYDRAQVVDFISGPTMNTHGDLKQANGLAREQGYDSKIVHHTKFMRDMEEWKPVDMEVITTLNDFMREEFNKILAYRSLSQINQFIYFYVEVMKEPMVDALDLQLVSKFIPKIKYAYINDLQEKLELFKLKLEEILEEKYNLEKNQLQQLEIVKQIQLILKEFNL